jgi:RNA-directed DNA polymerase
MYTITDVQIYAKPMEAAAMSEAALRFSKCKKLKHLAALLEIPKSELKALVRSPPQYSAFRIPKSDGSSRLIEAPQESLKKVQQKLNFYLQAFYFGIRPAAAYGGLLSVINDFPVRILSNARRHLHRQWFFNLDLEDFYHQIPKAKVVEILRGTIGISDKLANQMAGLCSFKNRLPMGAPTSCILANYACLDMDKALQLLADRNNLRYTRYIDDLTFSSKKQLSDALIEVIRTAITQCGFVINENKVSIKHLNDTPEITGLMILPNKIDISNDYIKVLRQDITFYRRMTKAGERITKVFQARTLSLYRQHLQGKINFVGFVRSKADATYRQLKKNMTVVVAHG